MTHKEVTASPAPVLTRRGGAAPADGTRTGLSPAETATHEALLAAHERTEFATAAFLHAVLSGTHADRWQAAEDYITQARELLGQAALWLARALPEEAGE